MPFDRIRLQKTLEGNFVILLIDTQLRNPFMQNSTPLPKEETKKKLREMEVPESEIEDMFARAENATGSE